MIKTDVLICGYGIGGLMSAYYCNQNNIKHIVIEKNNFPGGLSNLSHGGFATSNNVKETIKYLNQTNNHLRSPEHTKTMAQGMYDIKAELEKIAIQVGASVDHVDNINELKYKFDGEESIGCSELHGLEDSLLENFNPFIHFGNHKNRGWQTVYLLSRYNEKHGTVVLYGNEAKHIDNSKNVVTTNREKISYKKLIVATGGYESNKTMQLENTSSRNETEILNYGPWFNTGDGIKMLNQIGAMNYHMWHVHGSYAFKHPEDSSIGLRVGSSCRHVIVDENGYDLVNVDHTDPSDTRIRPLLNNSQASANKLKAFFVSDESNRQKGPFASVKYISYKKFNYNKWSNNNILEIKKGILYAAKDYKSLAGYIGCEVGTIKKTLEAHKTKLKKPFLVGQVFPMIANTQGGPQRNHYSQVLDSFGVPIPNVYSVGEIGSWWSHLYLSSGNWAEALIGSKIAIKHISEDI